MFGPPIMSVRYPRDRQQQLRVIAAKAGLSREALVRQLCDDRILADSLLAAPDHRTSAGGSSQVPVPPTDELDRSLVRPPQGLADLPGNVPAGVKAMPAEVLRSREVPPVRDPTVP